MSKTMYQINKVVSKQELDSIIESLNASIEVLNLDIKEETLELEARQKAIYDQRNLEEFVQYLIDDIRSPDEDEEE